MISKFIETLLTPLSDFVAGEVRQTVNNRLLEYKRIEYDRRFYTKTILHRAQPVKLLDIFYPLTLQNIATSKTISKVKSVKEIADTNRFITIIGTAGSGKSTFLEYLFLQTVKEEKGYPIFLELRLLNDYSGTLYDYIKNEIFLFSKLADNDNVFHRLLSSDKFVFFFDGYDELSNERRVKVTVQINSFIKLFFNNSYFLSSRPHSNAESLPMFTNFRLCELKGVEIIEFIKLQFFEERRELVSNIVTSIKKAKNSDYYSYVKNPLLLSMYILTFESHSKLPNQKSTFYKNVYDTLFYMHDSISKSGFERDKKSLLSREQFEVVLRRFCVITFFDEMFTFDLLTLDRVLSSIKSKKRDILFRNEDLIQDLQLSIGILRKEGNDYMFPHRSLQEYFAASFIAFSDNDHKKKLYKKFSNKVLKRKNRLTELNNFYTILLELDYSKARELFVIPTLKKIKFFKDNISISYKKRYEDFYRVEEIMSLFRINSKEFEKLNILSKRVEISSNQIKVIENELDKKNNRLILLKAKRKEEGKVARLVNKNRRKTFKKEKKMTKLKPTTTVYDEGYDLYLQEDRIEKKVVLEKKVTRILASEIEGVDKSKTVLEGKLVTKSKILVSEIAEYIIEAAVISSKLIPIIEQEIKEIREEESLIIDLI